ncbi:MAG TPA: penicillin acylase family protein, partial [Acetobacteraceae bacterium]|nr:penicillin acylase family protein [Acetobacteraceae bacterium]
ITERSVDIAVRGVGMRHATLRESRFGPVISDVKRLGLQQPTALGWVGHQPSDELTAMLTMNRAEDFAAFRHALRGFAVQGYSFTYADATGRVGILRAGHVPARPGTPADILEPASVLNDITSLAEATGVFDPREGFVVSANEDPQTAVQAGFFFAPSDRALRQAALLDCTGIERADLEALQKDVTSSSARQLRDALARRATELGLRLPQAVLDWNGCYDEESVGALAYEVLLAETADMVIGKAILAPVLAVWTSRALVASTLLGTPNALLRRGLSHGAKRAAQAISKGKCWGDAHLLHLAHPLARLPIWGRKFGVHIFGVPGSNDTLYKTGHGPARCGRRQSGHRVTYGSSARHLADFVDPDANFVIIMGGQDGWIGSVNATDQIPLWREGRYLRLPLTSACVAASFGRLTQLTPPP